MSELALELKQLRHTYGKFVALNSIDLQLPAGKIYGLLGRNGAGKTTLLNILSAAIFPKSGQALVFGKSTHEHVEALKKLCFVREKGMYPNDLKVWQALRCCRELYPNWDEAYAAQLLELFGLNPRKKYKQLSRGMESSLGLIIGLASRAPLTIFDEPSLGLDAVAREAFYSQLIHDVEQHPRTVVISTHLIDEVSQLFEEVVIIDKGRVLLQQPLEELLNSAVTLVGPAEAVERAAQGARVLHRDTLGGMAIQVVWQPEKREFAGVQVEPVSLQKLFVYLTEGGEA